MAGPNLYKILGIARQARAAAIKAAYRRKAKVKHPDAGGDPEEFRLLKLAADVLSDPNKRAKYDDTGEYDPKSFGLGDDDHWDRSFEDVLADAEEPTTPDDDAAQASDAEDQKRVRRAAVELLVAVIARIETPQQQDIVQLMRAEANQRIKRCTDDARTGAVINARIASVIDQIHVKNGDNVLRQAIVDWQGDLGRDLAQNEAKRRLYERVLAFLDVYRHDAEGFLRYISIDP